MEEPRIALLYGNPLEDGRLNLLDLTSQKIDRLFTDPTRQGQVLILLQKRLNAILFQTLHTD